MKPRRRTSSAQAVELLVEAHTTGKTLAGLPAAARPKTVRAGAALQVLFVDALGLETAGWKIGCTSAAARTLLKANAPFAGRVFRTRCFPSGATLPGGAYRTRGIEGEFAFVLGRDLKSRKRPYTRAEVAAAVAGLHPAIEIVDSRFTDIKAVTLPELVADLGINGALVVGAPVAGWRRRDLAAIPVTMRAGGRVVGKGRGSDALGHPLDALCWLANNPPAREGLRAGEFVSTGTCTGLHRAAATDKVTCDFGPLGKVAFAFV